jgi:chromosome segregation ATPase
VARRIAVEIVGDSSSLERAFKRSAASATGFNTAIGKVAGKTSGLFKGLAGPALAGLGIGGLASGISSSVQAASDLNEQINKNKVVFGQSSAAILDWSRTTANALGISRTQALDAAGGFGALLVPMGVARGKAADMSRSMVKLAADMASFNNTSPEQALEAIRSGLVGESEPLRAFGVRLSEARIQQQALSTGLMKGAQAADAAKTAYKTAGTAFKAAQKAQTTATRELTKAQTELNASQRAVTATTAAVATAQERLQATSQAVTGAQDRLQTAGERLTAANRSLVDAQKAGRDAQIALTAARKQATAQLKELKDSAVDAALSEQRAGLSLDQARQRLTDTLADQNATELDRRDALLSVREAERSLQEAQDRRRDTAKKARDADKKGVEGAKVVVDARKRVTDAHQREQTAQTRVIAAQRGLAAAQRGMATALGNVAKAQTDLATAQANASAAGERYAAAQTRLAAAQKNAQAATDRAKTAEDALAAAKRKSDALNQGGNKGLSDRARALATLALILKDTKDQQGDFGRTSDSLANAQRRAKAEAEDLQAVLGGKLSPSVTKVTNAVADWLAKSENQKTVMDTLTTVAVTVKSVVDALKGAFRLLSKATGGSRNAFALLIGLYTAWKVATIAGKVADLAGKFGGLKRKQNEARGAARLLRGSLVGKLGLAGAAFAVGVELGNLALDKIPGLRGAMYDLGGSAYDLAGKLGLVNDELAQFEGKKTPGQSSMQQMRAFAARMEARGVTTGDTAKALALKFPGFATRDYQVAAGVTGVRTAAQITINGGLHLNGIQNPRQLEDELHRRAKRRPASRR